MSGSTIIVRNPIGKLGVQKWELATRPEDLRGLTVGLTSNGWWSFNVILQRYKTLLKERLGVSDIFCAQEEANVKQFAGIARPKAEAMLEELTAKCDVAIVGMGN